MDWGNWDCGLGLGIGIKDWDWELGLRLGIGIGYGYWDCIGIGDWGLSMGIVIGNLEWDWGLGMGIGLRIGIGDWDRGLGLLKTITNDYSLYSILMRIIKFILILQIMLQLILCLFGSCVVARLLKN